MEIELTSNFKGKCLIAMPSINNDIFARSVVYITEHNSIGGAIGVIINKSMPENKQLFSTNFDFSKYTKEWAAMPFYFGGPVELGNSFVLHDSVDGESLILTGNRRKLHQLASAGNIKPWILTAGYCLWDSLQLEYEVRMNNWLVVDSSPYYFLQMANTTERYAAALKLVGVNNIASFDFSGAGNA